MCARRGEEGAEARGRRKRAGGSRRLARLVAPLLVAGVASCAVPHVGVFGGGKGTSPWVAPRWENGAVPQCAPVPLYWYVEARCPLLFRGEIEVPPAARSASALVRTAAHLYVYVDGEQVYAWPSPQPPQAPPAERDPDRVHALDLGRALAPGRHVLAVSSDPEGFAFRGAYYDRGGRPQGRVAVQWQSGDLLQPTTVMEPGRAPAAPVASAAVGLAPSRELDVDALRDVEEEARLRHLHAADAEARWRVALLRARGVFTVGDQTFGGLGFALSDRAVRADFELQALRLREGGGPLSVAAALRRLSRRAWLAAEREALRLIASEVDGVPSFPDALDAAGLRELRGGLERRLGHRASPLDRSRDDRLGWVPVAGLVDNDPRRWGVRFAAPADPDHVAAPVLWRFAPDPDDVGESERRWAPDYNGDDDWAPLTGFEPGGWRSDARFADYAGVGWYRARVALPRSWKYEAAELSLHIAGAARVWWDGVSLRPGDGRGEARHFAIPAELAAGGQHLLALRVEARGRAGGLRSSGEVRRAAEELEVESSPLSPALLIRPPGRLRIEHRGRLRVGLKSEHGVEWRDGYSRARDGRLRANWILLDAADVDASVPGPILLVFTRNPRGVSCGDGATEVELAGSDERVIAVRPFAAERPPAWADTDVTRRLELWSRAALAVPVHYVTVTRVAEEGEPWRALSIDAPGRGPLLEQTLVYAYDRASDEWGTVPLRVAPLPPFASAAVDRRPSFVHETVESIQPAGELAPYRARLGSDRVRYRYRVEPYPRLAGFTSWMFSYVDAGVAGNRREMELMAAAGANSLRAQHNWSDQLPGEANPGEKRARVEVLRDACNRVGLNYINNVDQLLGAESGSEPYSALRARLIAHYDRLAARLAPRPFFDVGYDLINEPFEHPHAAYNETIARLTATIRRRDRSHLLYVEPPESWGTVDTMSLVEPTGDPLTLYSFHDYRFRLESPDDRWPTPERDLASVYEALFTALRFQLEHDVALHCGEFGDFAAGTHAGAAQRLLLNDLFQVFDQFGMHHHYYSGRLVYLAQADGSLLPSNVVLAYRRYFTQGGFNAEYDGAR